VTGTEHPEDIVWREAIACLSPDRLVRESLEREPFPTRGGSFRTLALGKSAVPMIRGALAAGADPGKILVVAPAGPTHLLGTVRVLEGDHPIPSVRSFAAGEAVDRFCRDEPDEPLLALVSGGGSALAELPLSPFEPADATRLGETLLRSGLVIGEINDIRRRVSAIKGGALLWLRRGDVRTLVMSDLSAGSLASVASGPTIPPSPSRFDAAKALRALDSAGLGSDLLRKLARVFENGEPRATPSIPRHSEVTLASPEDFALAAAKNLEHRGYKVVVAEKNFDGPAEAFAKLLFESAKTALARSDGTRPLGVVLVGEPAIAIPPGAPPGGRAAHTALLAALAQAACPQLHGATLFSSGSDGVDGTGGGRGARIEPRLIRSLSDDFGPARDALLRFDATEFLGSRSALLPREPTGVNLRDLFLVTIPKRA